jgi:hypothetical protein
MKTSAFELLYGYKPAFTVPAGRKEQLPDTNARLDTLKDARKDAEAVWCMRKKEMRVSFEEDRTWAHVFKVGDKVMLDSENIQIHQASKKLGPKRLGPYKVIEVVGPLSYKLKLPAGLRRLHDTFHVDKLSPWKGNEVNGAEPPEPEEIEVEGEAEYEVEKVLNSRLTRGKLEYLVKWRGFNSGHNSWEPAENLDHARQRVNEFHKRNPQAPRRLAAALFGLMPWSTLENFTSQAKSLQDTAMDWETGRNWWHVSTEDDGLWGGGNIVNDAPRPIIFLDFLMFFSFLRSFSGSLYVGGQVH